MTESYLGIDVGFCKARRTTGLCLLTLNRDCLEWICRKTGSDKPQRRKDLRELIPRAPTYPQWASMDLLPVT